MVCFPRQVCRSRRRRLQKVSRYLLDGGCRRQFWTVPSDKIGRPRTRQSIPQELLPHAVCSPGSRSPVVLVKHTWATQRRQYAVEQTTAQLATYSRVGTSGVPRVLYTESLFDFCDHSWKTATSKRRRCRNTALSPLEFRDSSQVWM